MCEAPFSLEETIMCLYVNYLFEVRHICLFVKQSKMLHVYVDLLKLNANKPSISHWCVSVIFHLHSLL